MYSQNTQQSARRRRSGTIIRRIHHLRVAEPVRGNSSINAVTIQRHVELIGASVESYVSRGGRQVPAQRRARSGTARRRQVRHGEEDTRVGRNIYGSAGS